VASAVSAAPQYYIADTPDVQQAKIQFAAAYNAALARNGGYAPAAPIAVSYSDDSGSPAALPYIHEEIEALPYIHEEVEAVAYEHIEPQTIAEPIQLAANPIVYNNAPVYNYNGIQGYQNGGCYNWLGAGVPCREIF
jgi:hypothetical protein